MHALQGGGEGERRKDDALGERERVLGVALPTEAERLDAHEEQEGGEGVHRGPEVAHDVEPALDREDGVAEGLDEAHPVVALRGLGELGELARGGPVELAWTEEGGSGRRTAR